MNSFKYHFFTIILVSLIVSSCKKDKEPFVSFTPAISIKDITPLVVTQFKSSITLTLQYEDGDGDLGFENADSMSLHIKDSRLTLADQYYVQPLAPIGSNVAINGDLKITIKSIFLLGTNGAAETTTFAIKIKDRAGNWSNEVTSGNITINP